MVMVLMRSATMGTPSRSCGHVADSWQAILWGVAAVEHAILFNSFFVL